MKRTINFGKIDYNHSGRRNCAVTIDLELRDLGDGKLEFSACGDIWNPRHSDCYCGGQCLDEIATYVHDPLFKEIHRLWKAYHLNAMHAGTEKQEQILEDYRRTCETQENTIYLHNYDTDCKILQEAGLLEDDGYRYGSAWLYRAIPEDDLEIIKKIISGCTK